MSKSISYSLLLLFCAGILSMPVLSQIRSGTIVGKVIDPSGAAIPAAEITITAEETKAIFHARANTDGEYAVPYLQAGPYSLIAAASGFAEIHITQIEVRTAGTVRVNVEMKLSTTASSVEIAARGSELQTDSSSVQNAIGEEIVRTVPNITHNPFYYATLQAGVVPRQAMNDSQSANSFGIGIDGRRTFSAISANGGAAFSNDIQVDGVSVQGSAWNEAAVVPNSEGVQEVRTLVNNFSAEYGRAQGVIQVSTKNGTNDFHGSALYRLRNEALNANSFGNNARSIARAPFKVNSYAATIGGPVVRDKAFFFVSYEGLRHNEAVDFLKTVPTALERNGDFSKTFANVNGVPTPVKIFDPFSVIQAGPNQYQRSPIPNAIISHPDPFALKLYSFYPMPNRASQDVYNTNNYFLRGIRTFDKNSVNSRLDYRWKNHSFYGTGGVTQGSMLSPASWGDDNPFQSNMSFIGARITDNNPYAAIGDTIILSPSLLLDIRYGMNRINTNNEARTFDNFDYSQFGIPTDLQTINAVPGAPPEYRSGSGLSPLNNTNSLHKKERQTNHHLVGSMTKIANRWTFKFGGEYRVYLSNYTDAEESFLIFTDPSYTREMINAAGGGVGAVTPDAGGWEPASMLLGTGSIYVAPGRGVKPALAQKYLGLYSQNDWRATSKLTVNLGLRWDLQPGPTERYDRMSAFDFGQNNPYGSRGAYAFVGTNGYSRNYWNTQWNNFGPRIGLAYRLSDNLVLRAGYGITYLPSNTGYLDTPGMYGMESFAPFTNSNVFGPNPQGVIVGKYYQVNSIVQPRGSDPSNPGIYGGTPPWRFDRNDYLNAMAQQWNLFLQKRVGNNWLFSAGYSASKGDHLQFARVPLNSDQFLPDTLLGSWRSSYIAADGRNNPATEQIPNPLQPVGGALVPFNGNQGRATISRVEAAYPYPLFGGLSMQRSVGYSQYHSMQLQVSRSYANGLHFNAHYTWSKATDMAQSEAQTNGFADTGGYITTLDLRNYRNNKKLSLTDVPHRFVISYVYDLPFGAGKPIPLNNHFLSAIASGWRIGGVTTLQSGFPIQVTGAIGGSINGRPDRLSGVPVEVPQELQRWYDGKTTVTLPSGRQITPCAFCFLKYSSDAFSGRAVQTPNGSAVNDIYWFGNAAFTYADLRGAGRQNWNATLERTFRVRERFSLDLSAQFSNVFNSAQFRPNMTLDLGSTNLVSNSPSGVKLGQGLNTNFGTRGNDTFDPRQLELNVRIRF